MADGIGPIAPPATAVVIHSVQLLGTNLSDNGKIPKRTARLLVNIIYQHSSSSVTINLVLDFISMASLQMFVIS